MKGHRNIIAHEQSSLVFRLAIKSGNCLRSIKKNCLHQFGVKYEIKSHFQHGHSLHSRHTTNKNISTCIMSDDGVKWYQQQQQMIWVFINANTLVSSCRLLLFKIVYYISWISNKSLHFIHPSNKHSALTIFMHCDELNERNATHTMCKGAIFKSCTRFHLRRWDAHHCGWNIFFKSI